ncbi:MAG: phosphatidylinositol-specific phospholipase C [Alphaproteobacteria bacterium]|nr:phosphatidylinositol-specific phospholipase C [Alphaproteobacteria bacterium]
MRDRGARAGTIRRVAIGGLLSLVLVAPCAAHVSPGYSHDSTITTRHPDWMGALRDDVRLSQLSLPGTHDTMSFFGGDAVRTQTLSLPNQLESGIRVLDIRCRHVRFGASSYRFAIVHGATHQNAFFDDVLDAAVNFLKAHPRETVFMFVNEEAAPENIPPGRDFAMTFAQYWDDARWQKVFWQPPPRNGGNPRLDQIRGKIVILRNFPVFSRDPAPPELYGIDYRSLQIQDEFVMNSNWDLYDKWTKVLNHLRAADTGSQNITYMNYLSASRGSFPYFVASGHSNPATGAPRLATGRTTPAFRNTWLDFPRVNCWRMFWTNFCTIAFEGTNILTYDRLPAFRRVGMIMADFPGPGLIDRLVALNARFKR